MTAAALLGYIDVYFMGPSLVFMITYIWGRRHNYARLTMMVRIAGPTCPTVVDHSSAVYHAPGRHPSDCTVSVLGNAPDVSVAWPCTRR
jgi:hypothetical protein